MTRSGWVWLSVQAVVVSLATYAVLVLFLLGMES